MTDREAAWWAVHDGLAHLPGWTVSRAEYHGEEGRWHVPAVDTTNRGRRAMHGSISGSGATEIEALEALALWLSTRGGSSAR